MSYGGNFVTRYKRPKQKNPLKGSEKEWRRMRSKGKVTDSLDATFKSHVPDVKFNECYSFKKKKPSCACHKPN